MQDWNVLAPSSHSDHFAREHLPPHNEWPVFQADLPELQYPAILNCGGELVDRPTRAKRHLAAHPASSERRHQG